MSVLIPCIVAGGAGTRLWPVSREAMPKPFMPLPDGESLLRKTFRRAAALEGVASVLTVINRDLLFATLDEYRATGHDALQLDFLLEPVGRNTAPALAAAALHALEHHGEDAQLLVLPADHLIEDGAAFAAAVALARRVADAGYLSTFGIQPSRAETGYGYIECGQPLEDGANVVARFVEKPDRATAQAYVDGGRHLWNAGMFCFRADLLIRELALHAPALLEATRDCLARSTTTSGKRGVQRELDAEAFARVEDISIDYALMERSARVAVVPCDLGWSDIGCWQALSSLTPADPEGNRIVGEVALHAVRDCYINAPSRLVGAVGVENLIVVDTPDALLIASGDSAQDVKVIAQELKRRGDETYRLHRTVSRPWGSYTVLEEGSNFKIKRIVVRPGAALSLQLHHHRSEHWIVVSGMARVVNGERDFLLATNESTFIPAGHRHRLTNPGVVDLVMIEVQSGEYLGEDDIVRFDDIYGRTRPKAEAA